MTKKNEDKNKMTITNNRLKKLMLTLPPSFLQKGVRVDGNVGNNQIRTKKIHSIGIKIIKLCYVHKMRMLKLKISFSFHPSLLLFTIFEKKCLLCIDRVFPSYFCTRTYHPHCMVYSAIEFFLLNYSTNLYACRFAATSSGFCVCCSTFFFAVHEH